MYQFTGEVILTEAQFQQQIIELARLYGWRIAHFRPAWSRDGQRCMTAVAADGAGWPDLTLVKGTRLIFAEIKSDKGRISPDQKGWLDALKKVAEVYCWYPKDWEQIQEILTQ